MAATYRVIDILSNSQNQIFDYIIRPEHNTLYKSFKQAVDAANNKISFHLPGYPPEILFIRSNKKECDTTGGSMRQFRIGPEVECIVMIIRQTTHKPEPIPEEQRRRSARNRIHVNYIDILSESETDEEDRLPNPPRQHVKKEKHELPAIDYGMPEVVSAVVHLEEDPQNMYDDDL